MDIMKHESRFWAASGGRTPGGADYPVAVEEAFGPLRDAGEVTVGVVDTGIVLDDAHRPYPWFGDHVSFTDGDIDQLGVGQVDIDAPRLLADADGHGTFISGLILHEAPTARVIMVGALDTGNDVAADALQPADDRTLAAAVRLLGQEDPATGELKVQVINLSFAGGTFPSSPGELGDVLDHLDCSIAVVAAAGNDGSDQMVWPAAFPRVISVGALDERRLRPPGAMPPRAAFSNYGSWVKTYAGGVQVLGPFVDFKEIGGAPQGLRPAQHFRGWARWSGTSFAAAKVSGRIAQMVVEHPGMSGSEAAKKVLDGAPKISAHDAARGFVGSAGALLIL